MPHVAFFSGDTLHAKSLLLSELHRTTKDAITKTSSLLILLSLSLSGSLSCPHTSATSRTLRAKSPGPTCPHPAPVSRSIAILQKYSPFALARGRASKSLRRSFHSLPSQQTNTYQAAERKTGYTRQQWQGAQHHRSFWRSDRLPEACEIAINRTAKHVRNAQARASSKENSLKKEA